MNILEKILYKSQTINICIALILYLVIPGYVLGEMYHDGHLLPASRDEKINLAIVSASGILLFMTTLRNTGLTNIGALTRFGADIDDLGSRGLYSMIIPFCLIWNIEPWDSTPNAKPTGEVWINSKREKIDGKVYESARAGFKVTVTYRGVSRQFLRAQDKPEDLLEAVRSYAHGRLRPRMRAYNYDNIQDVKERLEKELLGYQFDEFGEMETDLDGSPVMSPINDLDEIKRDWGAEIMKIDLSDVLYTPEFAIMLESVLKEQFDRDKERIQHQHFGGMIEERTEDIRKKDRSLSYTEARAQASLEIHTETDKLDHKHVGGNGAGIILSSTR